MLKSDRGLVWCKWAGRTSVVFAKLKWSNFSWSLVFHCRHKRRPVGQPPGYQSNKQDWMVMMRWKNNTKWPELLLDFSVPVLILILGSKRKSTIDISAYILIYIEYIHSNKHCLGLKCGYKTFETCTHANT